MEIVDEYGQPGLSGHHARDLTSLRLEIDALDRRIVDILTERCRLAQAVGEVKSREGILPLDPAREAEIVKRAADAARKAGVPEEWIRDVFWTVLRHCRRTVSIGGTGVPRRAKGPDEAGT